MLISFPIILLFTLISMFSMSLAYPAKSPHSPKPHLHPGVSTSKSASSHVPGASTPVRWGDSPTSEQSQPFGDCSERPLVDKNRKLTRQPMQMNFSKCASEKNAVGWEEGGFCFRLDQDEPAPEGKKGLCFFRSVTGPPKKS